jgi:phosphonatase-like hydrolase
MISLVVLDMAGTTVQEHGAVYHALEDAVRAAGSGASADDVSRWKGAGKQEAVAALLSVGRPAPTSDEVASTFDDFRARLAARYQARPPTPVEGAEAALASLREEGVKVALTTGFSRDVVDDLLDVLGWSEGVVDAVVCIDDVAAGRPAPYMVFRAMERTRTMSVAEVLVCGDTHRDLEAGTNAGAGVVLGVGTGGFGLEELATSPHTHLMPSVAGIPDLLAGL